MIFEDLRKALEHSSTNANTWKRAEKATGAVQFTLRRRSEAIDPDFCRPRKHPNGHTFFSPSPIPYVGRGDVSACVTKPAPPYEAAFGDI